MKKQLLIITAAIMSITVFAQMPGVAGRPVNKNTKLPEGWLVQAQKADKETVVVSQNDQGKTVSVTFNPVKRSGVFFYPGNALKSSKGDTFKLEAKVKGTGKVAFGYFGYGAGNKFLFFKKGTLIELNGMEQAISDKLTVKDGKEYATAAIRPAVIIPQGSVCEIYDVKFTEE